MECILSLQNKELLNKFVSWTNIKKLESYPDDVKVHLKDQLKVLHEQIHTKDHSACVITGDPKHSQACHIVAIAHRNNKDSLPQSIKNLIYSLPNTINDVRNGLL
jgi:phosphotransferase system IIB component